MAKNKGITMISLVITIIVLFIITGITVETISGKNGSIIDKVIGNKQNIEKETLIQKIQSELFKEKTKRGRELTQDEKEDIIDNYGTITTKDGVKVLTTKEESYEILLSEIIL